MLRELRIVDLGVIGEAMLAPSPGFTAVTGETGAGKTMIVTGLTLLGGAKAEARLIRAGAARALVEGVWAIDGTAAARVAELGGEVDVAASGLDDEPSDAGESSSGTGELVCGTGDRGGTERAEFEFSHARNQSAETGVSADGQAHPRSLRENSNSARLAGDTGGSDDADVGGLAGDSDGRGDVDSGTAASRSGGNTIELADNAGGAGEVLVSRQLTPSRSRLLIGGAQVPLAQAADLLGEWVTVHGQSEQLRLGSPERQREVLDAFAGEAVSVPLAAYRDDYEERRRAAAKLAELTERAAERLRELDVLTFGLDEIQAAQPQPGEDDTLQAEAVKLQAVDDLRLAAREAVVALAGDDDAFDAPSAMGLVAEARKALTGALAADPQLKPLSDQLADAAEAIADASSTLASYLDGLDADPGRLEWIAGRLAELQHLTRKYGGTVDSVLAWAEQAAARVADLGSDSDSIDELTARIASLDEALASRATVITRERTTAAARLAEQVGDELSALAMPSATLRFEVSPASALGPYGADHIALLFSANPGSAPGPLGKIASGGELSRVRLALEVVLAGAAAERSRTDGAGGVVSADAGAGAGPRSANAGPTKRAASSGVRRGPTFVFDEVDAGVGGTVALEIGRRLRRLAEHAQVIVVTHLAQVAAFADRQFVVQKADDGRVTTSGVREVVGDERLDVLARMMGGLDDSESARAHAAELLTLARS